jgi:hypothetical protein
MKLFTFFIFLFFCFSSLMSQTNIIYLQDTTLNASCRFTKEVDSTIVKAGVKYEYFTIPSPYLIPTLKNYNNIRLRIKTTKNGKSIKQYFGNEGESCWASVFNNNSRYKLFFNSPVNSSKGFYTHFKVKVSNGKMVLSTKEAFYAQIKDIDTLINFIIRPYIIFQQNIRMGTNQNSKSLLGTPFEFDESFELWNKRYYKLINLEVGTKTIRLDSVSYQEGILGYKTGKFINDFEGVKRRLNDRFIDNQNKIFPRDYYLFYFWGEWCQPCVKKIDENKKTFMKFDLEKLNLINIAFLSRNKESEAKTIDLIRENKISGFHIIENQKSLQSSLIKKLNVSTYPSYVVVDSKGKVIYRTDDKEGVPIETFFKANDFFK